MGYAHGHNDAQKTMGIIALTLFGAEASGALDDLPGWLGFLHPGNAGEQERVDPPFLGQGELAGAELAPAAEVLAAGNLGAEHGQHRGQPAHCPMAQCRQRQQQQRTKQTNDRALGAAVRAGVDQPGQVNRPGEHADGDGSQGDPAQVVMQGLQGGHAVSGRKRANDQRGGLPPLALARSCPRAAAHDQRKRSRYRPAPRPPGSGRTGDTQHALRPGPAGSGRVRDCPVCSGLGCVRRCGQRRRLTRHPSAAKISRAAQMQAKPTSRSGPNGSRKNSTPVRNCRVGPMYCSSPTVDSGTRCTP